MDERTTSHNLFLVICYRESFSTSFDGWFLKKSLLFFLLYPAAGGLSFLTAQRGFSSHIRFCLFGNRCMRKNVFPSGFFLVCIFGNLSCLLGYLLIQERQCPICVPVPPLFQFYLCVSIRPRSVFTERRVASFNWCYSSSKLQI